MGQPDNRGYLAGRLPDLYGGAQSKISRGGAPHALPTGILMVVLELNSLKVLCMAMVMVFYRMIQKHSNSIENLLFKV